MVTDHDAQEAIGQLEAESEAYDHEVERMSTKPNICWSLCLARPASETCGKSIEKERLRQDAANASELKGTLEILRVKKHKVMECLNNLR